MSKIAEYLLIYWLVAFAQFDNSDHKINFINKSADNLNKRNPAYREEWTSTGITLPRARAKGTRSTSQFQGLRPTHPEATLSVERWVPLAQRLETMETYTSLPALSWEVQPLWLPLEEAMVGRVTTKNDRASSKAMEVFKQEPITRCELGLPRSSTRALIIRI